ncbi:hypothetical protein [Meiothermus hypogaeus]|uniref:Uncharacterized protein n=2 Tax=Meiothermus hypogaeus TaxID=884155 RepID=A0A511R5R9_9DEIN|nr:hypothetical protein [Meiothermus hypogaeus]RIH80532.1 hypothetical protein Mhypo_00448 [Meiothermus hypogaeus]GEM84950.1 hypothetical protein MHY01S_31160 [Meiothermus hypogaeus NBRC 106114]GIW36195.1 MAG: hypothetical protein KatS3mg073_0340 [Meiothermus sp.]
MKTMRVITRLLVALWFLAGWVQLPALAQLPLWPSLEQLLQGEPPITTSLNDAVTDVPFLDDFNPTGFVGISALPRGPQQGFVLRPGLFAFEAQSYCLNAGAYAPSKGDGYVYAPLKGARAGVIASLLRRSVERPEIAQRDIQALIWAILSRTRLSDMSPRMLAVATQLLTPQEMFEVNGGALGLIPESLLRQMMARLPQPIQQLLEAEARLRSLLTQANTTFEQLERAAVRFGVAPRGEGSREIPEGRWSYHPDGYFIRYFPSGYSHTRVELYVPEALEVRQDALGRIISIADAYGNRIETTYDDAIPPLTIAGDAGIQGYAFRSIRFVQSLEIPPEMAMALEFTWENRGWTLLGLPAGAGLPDSPLDSYKDAAERYRWAIEHLRQIKRIDQVFRVQGEPRVLVDLGLYTRALKQVLQQSQPNAPSWAEEHLGLAYRAWQAALCQREGGCQGTLGVTSGHIPLVQWVSSRLLALLPTRNKELDGGVAAPGNTSNQRLAQSNTGNDKKDACQTIKDELLLEQLALNAYRNPDLLKYATDRNLDDTDYDVAVKNYVARVWDSGRTPSSLTPEDVAAMFTTQRTERFFGPAMAFDPHTGSVYFNQSKEGEPDWIQILDMDGRPTENYAKASKAYEENYGKQAGNTLFNAHVEHEKVHQRNRWKYPGGFPENLSKNEIEAYQKSVEIKQQGLKQLGCP